MLGDSQCVTISLLVNAMDCTIHALGVWGLVGTEIPSSASQRVAVESLVITR